jgi:superfamily II DNA or RNA helicase
MNSKKPFTGSLPPGLYDQLLSRFTHEKICDSPDPQFFRLADIDPEDAHGAVAKYLEQMISVSLSSYRGKHAVQHQRNLIARIVTAIAEELGPEWAERFNLSDPLQKLLAVDERPEEAIGSGPDTPLSRSALLTGTRLDPSLSSQLSKEIITADRVDVLCSFIKWSGLRLLLDGFRKLTSNPHQDGPRLRVITTSYMGATDPKAIEELSKLPNTEIKVSYDTTRTRLHAKAYIIHRATGFGSAYIGSANISRAALSEGLEWTNKISQYELHHLWQKIIATFETYWNDEEFELYDESAPAKLREAIKRESGSQNFSDFDMPTFNLRPYPFQEEILDVLAAEREIQNKNRHLVVAATGTGKTMIAAFDYLRWSGGRRPSVLFIAHRKEILKQALGTFRAVLRDHNFGDLLVGGFEPQQTEHLFCSIQSFNSKDMQKLDAARYDYIVIDEFHHAAAPSYRRLLDHVRPSILLGLTATPDRADGFDILEWFGGEASAEIRLPDAIDRRLLSPFQYFGVADCVDLDGLRWQRGGYRVDDLDGVYTGNDIRARLVVDKVRETLLNPLSARGLGFCVSVAHANFMARFFNESGIPALALSAKSPETDRRTAQERLVRHEINFIFVVDLYNEGVDIPQVDTVLFLRPTESLTVYLQQLGRGLRLHDDKDCLTVLDFIGAQRREFRFASRFRVLSSDPTGRLETEIEGGFPHLPAGCFIRLERVAQQRVLENVRQSLKLRRDRIVKDLRDLGSHLGQAPSFRQALEYLDTTLPDLLKRGLWSRLLADAGLVKPFESPNEKQLAKGIFRLSHMDDPKHLKFLIDYLNTPEHGPHDGLSRRRLAMLFISLWGQAGQSLTLEEAKSQLRVNPQALNDLQMVMKYNLSHTHTRPKEIAPGSFGALSLHAKYTRDEILAGLGHWEINRRPDFREGTLHLRDQKIDAFFVTLNKTQEAYSPTTMYEDYAISDRLFHWQSQSTTSAESATGLRYIRQRENGYTPLFFVREYKTLPSGLASPYAFLGAGDYVSHEGSKPISFIWRLRVPMPIRLLRVAAG